MLTVKRQDNEVAQAFAMAASTNVSSQFYSYLLSYIYHSVINEMK